MTDTGWFASTTFTATASQTSFAVGFPALKSAHVNMAINGVLTATSDWSIAGDLPGNSGTLTWTGTAISSGDTVRLWRDSPDTFATLLYQGNAVDPLTEADSDQLVKALLYKIQEREDAEKVTWVDRSTSWTVEPATAQGYAVDTSAASVTATLPAAASNRGVTLYFKMETAGNTLVLDGNGAETVDGAATLTIASSTNAFRAISCDGDEWHVVGTS